ncbi:MAG: DUF1849 family protein [Bauldia sp.]|nr:DUF1849 family protein [Bauldia sp.]
MGRLSIAAPIALVMLAGDAAAGQQWMTGLAIYDVSLDPDKASGLAAITGTMTVSLERECAAYLTAAELDARLTGGEGVALPLYVSSRHVETEDRLEFDITSSLAGIDIDRAKGVATRQGNGIDVALEEPGKRTAHIDGDALFPLALIAAAIDAAEAGETFREFRTFDGTGKGEEVWTVSALITPAGDTPEDGEFAAGLGLADMPHWRMGLAYFPPGRGGEQTPAFSTNMIVYQNGFAQAAVYDLGEFALRLTLAEFRPLPEKPCP